MPLHRSYYPKQEKIKVNVSPEVGSILFLKEFEVILNFGSIVLCNTLFLINIHYFYDENSDTKIQDEHIALIKLDCKVKTHREKEQLKDKTHLKHYKKNRDKTKEE